jgi:hypothetical protein
MAYRLSRALHIVSPIISVRSGVRDGDRAMIMPIPAASPPSQRPNSKPGLEHNSRRHLMPCPPAGMRVRTSRQRARTRAFIHEGRLPRIKYPGGRAPSNRRPVHAHHTRRLQSVDKFVPRNARPRSIFSPSATPSSAGTSATIPQNTQNRGTASWCSRGATPVTACQPRGSRRAAAMNHGKAGEYPYCQATRLAQPPATA